MRIEARIRPPKKNEMLKSLWSMELSAWNRLKIYSRSLESNSRLPKPFIDDLREYPIQAAFGQLRGDAKKRRNTKLRILRAIKDHELNLFNQTMLEANWPECVRQMGILGDPVAWQRKCEMG